MQSDANSGRVKSWRAMETITVNHIQPKPYKRGGTTYQPNADAEFHAEIIKNKSIRIFGTYPNHKDGPQTFDRTFKVGDIVEYDSYNFSYTGPIVAIGAKTVKVSNGYSHQESFHVLDL